MINVAYLNKYIDRETTRDIVEGLYNNGFGLAVSNYDSAARHIPLYIFIKDRTQVFVVPQNSKNFDIARIQTPENQIDIRIHRDSVNVDINSEGWEEYKYVEIIGGNLNFYNPPVRTYRGEAYKGKNLSVSLF